MKTAALRMAIDDTTFYLMIILLTFYISKPIIKALIKCYKEDKLIFEEDK